MATQTNNKFHIADTLPDINPDEIQKSYIVAQAPNTGVAAKMPLSSVANDYIKLGEFNPKYNLRGDDKIVLNPNASKTQLDNVTTVNQLSTYIAENLPVPPPPEHVNIGDFANTTNFNALSIAANPNASHQVLDNHVTYQQLSTQLKSDLPTASFGPTTQKDTIASTDKIVLNPNDSYTKLSNYVTYGQLSSKIKSDAGLGVLGPFDEKSSLASTDKIVLNPTTSKTALNNTITYGNISSDLCSKITPAVVADIQPSIDNATGPCINTDAWDHIITLTLLSTRSSPGWYDTSGGTYTTYYLPIYNNVAADVPSYMIGRLRFASGTRISTSGERYFLAWILHRHICEVGSGNMFNRIEWPHTLRPNTSESTVVNMNFHYIVQNLIMGSWNPGFDIDRTSATNTYYKYNMQYIGKFRTTGDGYVHLNVQADPIYLARGVTPSVNVGYRPTSETIDYGDEVRLLIKML